MPQRVSRPYASPHIDGRIHLTRADRQKMVELQAKGCSLSEIKTYLAQNCNLHISRTTINRHLKTCDSNIFREELIRQQLRTIDTCGDLKLQLDFRYQMLKTLMSKRLQTTSTTNTTITMTLNAFTEERGNTGYQRQTRLSFFE